VAALLTPFKLPFLRVRPRQRESDRVKVSPAQLSGRPPLTEMSTPPQESLTSRLTSIFKSTAGSLTSGFQPAENELARWRRTFERFATEEKEGKK